MNDKPTITETKRSKVWFIALPLMLTLIVGGVYLRRSQKAYTEVGKLERRRIVEAVYGLGTVTARKSYNIKLGLTGQVRKVFVREGDSVKKGDPLVSVEGATEFKAPFDATVTSVPFKEGETAYPQNILMKLTDLNDNYIVVSLDQRAAMKVRTGLPVTLSFEGNREKAIKANVASVYPNDGQFLVRIDSDAIPATALPGMTVDVAIEVTAKEGALLAPVAGVQKGYLIVGSSHQVQKVETGLVDGARVEILSGQVKEGDPVFVRPK